MASVFGNQKSKSLEIILDSPFAVFYGDPHEAAPVAVSGILVLNTSDHMNVRGVRLKLTGRWRVGWTSYGSTSGNPSSTQFIRDKGILLKEEKQFIPANTSVGLPSTTHRIAPGRHEWRFEFMLDSSLPESIEGLSGNHIIYDLSAEIDRGYMSKSLLTTKHLRVIRTLSRDMTETVPFPYSNEDTWADKIKYHIYIPSRYYAFGTSIPVQFTLIPLRKGVKIGKIKMEVIERVTLKTEAGESQTNTMADKIVSKMEQACPAESSRTLVEESSGLEDESYHFEAVLPLQRSLNTCRQSVSTENIKVFHNLKIYVNIHNPDGHISQLCLRNLIHLYISPHMRINEDQIMTPSQSLADPIQGIDQPSPEAPPTYGTHLMDQLYDNIDMSGFNSGMATPANYLSRQPSLENLASRLQAAFPSSGHVSADTSRSSSITDPAALQLQNRLSDIDRLQGSTSRNHSPGFDEHQIRSGLHHQSLPTIEQRSRQATPPNDQAEQFPTPSTHQEPSARLASYSSPHPQAMSIGSELSRVPSYNTAVRTPYASRSPILEGVPENASALPSYDYAVGLVNAANTPHRTSLPPTPPSDHDTIGYTFAAPVTPPSLKNVSADATCSSEIPNFRRSSQSPNEPDRRNSNPPVPVTNAGRMSGFWQGFGLRRGSQ